MNKKFLKGKHTSVGSPSEQDVHAFDLWFKTENINVEFEERLFGSEPVNEKAVGFFVDANILVRCKSDLAYRQLIKSSTFNFVDGRFVALLVSWFARRTVKAFPGPAFFASFGLAPLRHLVVGGAVENFETVAEIIKRKNTNIEAFEFLELPFCALEEFDFDGIVRDINRIAPDIVWVSLGAPKQEEFISRIFPQVQKGYFFAVGAALGFFSGKLTSTDKFGRLPVVWILRLTKEPRKQFNRCIHIVLNILPLIVQAWRQKH